MKTFKGIGACGALAVGRISVYKKDAVMVCRRRVSDVAGELVRLEAAKRRAMEELSEVCRRARREVGDTGAQIFEIHAMMVEDEDFNESVRHIVESQQVNAEFAVALTGENFAQMFAAMEDSYMRARAADIREVSSRIVACFGEGERVRAQSEESAVLCAVDLAPGETVSLDKSRVLAFVTEQGSHNSHTAILARTLGIPAVVGVGEGFLASLREGERIAVDGYTGEVFVDPDGETLALILEKQRIDTEKRSLLERLRGKPNVTLDGHSIHIFANVGGVEQIGAVLYHDAGGIGLFRSEFLYLDREDLPGEEEQFNTYRKLLESMGGKRVIVRTLDIGADKQAVSMPLQREENPALGVRGVRLYRLYPEVIRTQLRALLRASVYGKLGIMFPMIIDVGEVEEMMALCRTVQKELAEAGVPTSGETELGIMIETPAAALISDRLAPMVDFFSVGTNDLTQYTLACDRQNPELAEVADPHHEGILRLIEAAAENAHRGGAWIGICGELAADTALTERFLRMGIDELSVTPSEVLRVRDAVRRIDLRSKADA